MPGRASINSIVSSEESGTESEDIIDSSDEGFLSNTQGGVTDLTSDGITDSLDTIQQENFRLRQENKKLRLKAASERTEAKVGSKRKTKSKEVPNSIKSFDDDIAKFGRKYSLMISPWINSSIFDNIAGRPDIDPTSEDRYETKEKRNSSTIAELYDFLPQNLHKIMEKHSYFVGTFRHHLQATRSNAVLSIRQKAGLLYKMPQEYFETSYDRASVATFQEMLKLPNDDGYAILAPILFADNKYDPTMKKLFKNPLLPKIAKTMLCGRSSSKSRSRPQTLAELWKVTNSTPGLIALTAVIARFMISPDEELRMIGKVSRINWEEDFTRYKRIMLGNSKKVKEVFRFFDENIFETSVDDTPRSTTREGAIEEFEDALRAINFDDSESEELEDADRSGGTGSSATSVVIPPFKEAITSPFGTEGNSEIEPPGSRSVARGQAEEAADHESAGEGLGTANDDTTKNGKKTKKKAQNQTINKSNGTRSSSRKGSKKKQADNGQSGPTIDETEETVIQD